MKMFRRLICLAVVLLMTLGALCACGNTENDAKGRTEDVELVTFVLEPTPDVYEAKGDVTDEMIDAAVSIIKKRLVNRGISAYEATPDYKNDRITVKIPKEWDEKDYDPLDVFEETVATGYLSFRNPDGEVVMDGSYVEKASAGVDLQSSDGTEYLVTIEFTPEGKEKFAEITEEYTGQDIYIYMDETLLSAPTVQAKITDGSAQIRGNLTAEDAEKLADQINSESLPFSMECVETDLL